MRSLHNNRSPNWVLLNQSLYLTRIPGDSYPHPNMGNIALTHKTERQARDKSQNIVSSSKCSVSQIYLYIEILHSMDA